MGHFSIACASWLIAIFLVNTLPHKNKSRPIEDGRLGVFIPPVFRLAKWRGLEVHEVRENFGVGAGTGKKRFGKG